VKTESGLATRVVRALDRAGALVDDVEVQQPSLDDVFFALTGGPVPENPAAEDPVAEDRAAHDREEGVA
jgi:ABC-2 type transport system ATP-binding protein